MSAACCWSFVIEFGSTAAMRGAIFLGMIFLLRSMSNNKKISGTAPSKL
jgi:hypothetical protein